MAEAERQQLWAPWRMAYIRGPRAPHCIFCEYPAQGPARHRENLVLCERPRAFVMLNRYPFAAGHLMVVPRAHASDLSGLTQEDHTALFDLARDATTALRTACNAQGVNLGINLGAAAGAGIAEHLHVHLVPRWSGDLNFMPVIAGVSVMPEHLDDSWARLRPHFEPLQG
ncbi:MAG: HIT domain-containing protein [Deltaproteobacteria bacterium]|nr:HIT domain-containing protein [Deltaproteobacteria bacterium]